MADIIVPIVEENLIELLAHDADLLLKVKDQVCIHQNDLVIMNAFLKDAVGKRNQHHSVK